MVYKNPDTDEAMNADTPISSERQDTALCSPVECEVATRAEEESGAQPANSQPIVSLEIAGPSLIRDTPKGLLLTTCDSFLIDWCFTMLIGFFVVSYWRGGWVLLDLILCDQPETAGLINGESFCFAAHEHKENVRRKSAFETLIAGYILLGLGLVSLANGLWKPSHVFEKSLLTRTRLRKAPVCLVIVLLLGAGTICLWRSIWYLLDYYVYPSDALKSYKLTTGMGVALCASLCSTASLLAPPAIFLMDGPSHLPPPIGVTIITSYRSIAYPAHVSREKNKKDPLWLVIVDMVLSYVILPIGVVGFWRGCWLLLDHYLWGFTAEQVDVNRSIVWSALLGMGALVLASDDFTQHFTPEEILVSPLAIQFANEIFCRIRSLILGFGAVNFWRAIWYIWDEYLGKTHVWSAAISHCLGVVGLLVLGCLSCITAPPSTLGVDASANPECSDEPLFHNVPVPTEALYIMSIARRPEVVLKYMKAPEGSILSDRSVLGDPSALSDITHRPDLDVPPEICLQIDDILVQGDYVCSEQARTTRFTEQAASHVQSSTRMESSSSLRLSSRHMSKRHKSQFFRSR